MIDLVARLHLGPTNAPSSFDIRIFYSWWSDVYVQNQNCVMFCRRNHVPYFTVGHDPRSNIWSFRSVG